MIKISTYISIVIPAQDRIDMLKKTLFSVVEQTYKDFKVIVVENNSVLPSEVHAIVEKMDDERLFSVSLSDCANANVARNFGARYFDSKLILFLDSDDVWESNHIENIVSCFRKFGVDFVYGGAKIYDGEKFRVKPARNLRSGESPADYILGFRGGYGQTSSMAISKSGFDKVFWDESLKRNQDLDFFIRCTTLLPNVSLENISVVINWVKGEKRGYCFDSMTSFYNKYKSIMRFSTRFRCLLIMFTLSKRTSPRELVRYLNWLTFQFFRW